MDETKIQMTSNELDAVLAEKATASYNEGFVKASEEFKKSAPLAIHVGEDRSDKLKLGRLLFSTAKESSKQSSMQNTKLTWDANGFNKTLANENVVKAMSISEVSTGGALIPDSFANEIIPYLRPISAVRQTGVRVDPLPTGRRTYRLNSTGAVGYWVSPGARITSSTPTAGTYEMLTKKAGAIVGVQNELLRYGGSDIIYQTIQDDAVRAIAQTEDTAFLIGTGDQGQPKGLLNWCAAANLNDMTGSVTTITKRADLIKHAGLIKRASIAAIDPVVFMNGRTYYDLLASVDANSNPAFERYLLTGNLFGYKVIITENIPILTSGDTGSYVMFADMGYAVIGQGLATELEFFPNATWDENGSIQYGISSDMSAFRVITEVDFMLKYAAAAAIIKKVTWGA